MVFKRVNPKLFKKFWCELKHLLVFRELGIEYFSNIAREVVTSNNVEEALGQSDTISFYIGQSEKLIQNLLDLILVDEGVASATSVRVDPEQFRRFLQQIGHIVCCEEHYVDHIKAGSLALSKTEDEKEKEEIANGLYQLVVRLDETRRIRQEYIMSFITPEGEGVEKETEKLP